MATRFYNHTRKLFANTEVDVSALKLMLLNAHTFNAAATTMAAITPDEVSGNGWTAGGESIASAAVTIVDTNAAMLDGDNISKTATGGDIGPATSYVIYDSVSGAPLFEFTFASAQTAGVGTPFLINFNANGIARWLAPA